MQQALLLSPTLKSWISCSEDSDFPIQNLPLGIYRKSGQSPRVCSIIGTTVIDLFGLYKAGVLKTPTLCLEDLEQETLNRMLAKGKATLRNLRKDLSEIFRLENESTNRSRCMPFLQELNSVTMCLPVKAPNYTDFYSSREHAYNVGVMFRDPNNALLPNWLHLPVGYHGRASSIVVSGTPVIRPKGQMQLKDGEAPVFGASKQLDFELEMAFVIGKSNQLGHPIPVKVAEDYIHGMLVFNDWSARDLQKWEYVPLGPFLGKNFASSISPWMVDLDALQTFKVEGPPHEKPLLEYLQSSGPQNYDIQLEVYLITPDGSENLLSKSNMKYLYWNMSQQLAHHTVNGCNMEVGDLCASGTISGPTPDSYGSMLELAWKGTKPLLMKDGSQRTFVMDGDTIIMKAFAKKDNYRIGFGVVRGMVVSDL
jgi:fumarylacetoacetase